MTAHNRRLKFITLAIGTPPVSYECQVTSWNINNNTDDGDQIFTYCPDGEFREEADSGVEFSGRDQSTLTPTENR